MAQQMRYYPHTCPLIGIKSVTLHLHPQFPENPKFPVSTMLSLYNGQLVAQAYSTSAEALVLAASWQLNILLRLLLLLAATSCVSVQEDQGSILGTDKANQAFHPFGVG